MSGTDEACLENSTRNVYDLGTTCPEPMSQAERPERAPIFQFGVFELDLRTRELRKRGVKLRIQDQPLHILLVLLERQGEIVTRDDIQKRLWPDNTYVDFDNAINSAMRKLREALGDSPENPRFVETIARRGYRFLAPVSYPATGRTQPTVPGAPIEANHVDPSPAAEVPPPLAAPPRPRKWTLLFFTISAVCLASVGLAIWFSRNAAPPPPAAPVPLTSYPGFQMFPSFSPEGTRVAFSWSEPDKRPSAIYVKMIGSGEPVRLTSSQDGDIAPAWSPDGKFIAFLRRVSLDQAAVMTMPALGGPQRELARIDFSWQLAMIFAHNWEGESPAPFIAWSSDSKWLLAISSRHVVRISVESGEKRSVTDTRTETGGDSGLSISPNGKTLAFVRTITHLVSDIYTVPISGDLLPVGEPQRVTFDRSQICGLTWSSDSRSLIFSSARSGRLELWRTLAEPASEPVKLAVTGDDPYNPVISPSTNRLVYAHEFGYSNLWRLPLQGKQTGDAEQLLPSTREEGHPQYSPDGKRIAFEAGFSGSEEIWVANANGSNPLQLTSFGRWAGSPRWSPDGRRIAFDCDASGNWDVYVIDAQGGKPTRLTTNSAEDSRPSWSHDGKWIYFDSFRSGDFQIWKVPVGGGREIQLTENGGYIPYEYEDGQALYYQRHDGIWKMPFHGKPERAVPIITVRSNYALSKRGIYLIDQKDSHLKLFEFATETIKTIAPVPGPLGDEMTVSPDERWLIYGRTSYAGSELMLVENFR